MGVYSQVGLEGSWHLKEFLGVMSQVGWECAAKCNGSLFRSILVSILESILRNVLESIHVVHLKLYLESGKYLPIQAKIFVVLPHVDVNIRTASNYRRVAWECHIPCVNSCGANGH